MRLYMGWTASLVLAAACSGSGVSTTARTDDGMADGLGDGIADDAGDDAAGDDGSGGDGSDPSADDGGTGSTPPDDDGSDPSADTGAPADDDGVDDGPTEIALAGTWLSEGDDVAPLLVELTGAQSITATFDGQTFLVVTIDDQGQEVMQSGVYTATPSGVGDIFDIVLEQSSPTSVTAEGIFEIDASVSPAILRYEIVQTMPSVGAIPPTAEGGFGSTAYGDDLTQIYVRQ